MALRLTHYMDEEGRKWRTLIPEGMPETEQQARMGIPAGPVSTDTLGWPPELQVRLHNQLFDRGIWGPREAVSRPQDVQGAIIAALKTDVQRVLSLYRAD